MFSFWSNSEFELVRGRSEFQNMQESWVEQRSFLYNAVAALDPVREQSLVADIASRIAQLRDVAVPSTAGFVQVTNFSALLRLGRYELSFDPHTGGIAHLVDTATGIEWASGGSGLAAVVYQTFNQDDVDRFLAEYSPCQDFFAKCHVSLNFDFGKPGIFEADARHRTASPALKSLWLKQLSSGSTLLLELELERSLHTGYGAPASLWLEMAVPANDSFINVTLSVFNKTATRLPEALWLSFDPKPTDAANYGWQIDKLGEWVSPSNVVLNGSQHLHGFKTGAGYFRNFTSSAAPAGVFIRSIDAAVLSVGAPFPWPTPVKPPADVTHGVSFALHNNAWNTNYILWYPFLAEDSSFKFRFALEFSGS
eukprot:TRINITY_DN24205_c0_g1_i1.p2 TRINITY_DN24205_c0_g1~~TRINITY_DN24205_c0_g1_i1.p2  ORF type:complete len:367 (+),score=141.03 TRINITY_DN24205_c0_g1_i1:548-1648(+)